jgi:hypothetical protein
MEEIVAFAGNSDARSGNPNAYSCQNDITVDTKGF